MRAKSLYCLVLVCLLCSVIWSNKNDVNLHFSKVAKSHTLSDYLQAKSSSLLLLSAQKEIQKEEESSFLLLRCVNNYSPSFQEEKTRLFKHIFVHKFHVITACFLFFWFSGIIANSFTFPLPSIMLLQNGELDKSWSIGDLDEEIGIGILAILSDFQQVGEHLWVLVQSSVR